MPEKTIIDNNAVQTAKAELDDLLRFFHASPKVLSDSALVSDPFTLMRKFINSDWNNMTARLLFSSARKLYRQFGSNSALYFNMIEALYTKVQTLSNQTEVRKAIDEWKATSTFWSNPVETLNDLDAAGFDPLVSKAIYTANGGLVAVEPGLYTHAGLDIINTAVFPIVPSQAYTLDNPSTLVMFKPLSTNKLAALCSSNEHTLLICLGHSAKLSDFVAANRNKLSMVEIYQEYEADSIYSDLCALTGQISGPNGQVSSTGKLHRAEINPDTLTLFPRQTRLRSAAINTLHAKHTAESSPLVQALIEKRLRQLYATETQINYPSLSTGEASSLDAFYTTQLLEASNALDSGVAENTETRVNSGVPVSSRCYTTCATLAAADILSLFSPIKITKQYTD